MEDVENEVRNFCEQVANLEDELQAVKKQPTKFKTRRILHFLKANKPRGSICLQKAFHFSSEVTMKNFWESYSKLTPNPNLDDHENFKITINYKQLEELYKTNTTTIKGNKLKVLWYLYNTGYVFASYMIKEGRKKDRWFIVFKWVNHQKRIAFKHEYSYRTANNVFFGDGKGKTSIEKIQLEFLNGKKFQQLFKEIKVEMSKKTRKTFMEHEKKQTQSRQNKFNIDEKQFQEEFIKEFRKSIIKKLKLNWPSIDDDQVDELFYAENEEYLEIWIKQKDMDFTKESCKIDTYGFINFRDDQNDLYIVVELKEGNQTFRDFTLLYAENKHYCDIDELKDKNVLYVIATLVPPTDIPLNENNIGFEMKGVLTFIPYYKKKRGLKYLTWNDHNPIDGVYLF
eukprot:GAHX01002949.1.p1 GENE.GAHX01002949.1~~GAHX01002949.1.p1  ORF type:complete len:398 (+),score=63.77 GAHX01002949.1:316-1509(+)